MISRNPYPGDVVVYRKSKFSSRPGPRAKAVQPTAGGDDYTYYVEKYWVVADVADNGMLHLKTRTGKSHWVESSDPMLRPVAWWERWLRGSQMPTLAEAEAAEAARRRSAEKPGSPRAAEMQST